ncbi:alpha/beta fold hydrolase [uncultured Friedmanniella sp.]|uniref:alpha/beta fold hydrolase n=1 Tax=uncultured Friedmanniella sp. TaxID=335381 RepID=UPI0035CC1AF4
MSAVELGGRRVWLTEQEGRRPAVVLLGGCGVPSALWQPVVDLLPGRCVVRLDRPGMLGTPWPGRLPRLDEEVATLAALVGRTRVPVVLVGHSMAGPHAEVFVRRYPELVQGLVVVDGSVEWDLRPAGRRDRALRAFWLVAARAVQSGLRPPPLRLVARLGGRVVVAAQSRLRLWEPMPAVAALGDPDAAASVVAENGAYTDQLRDLDRVRAERPWPGLPTVVLTAAGDGGSSWVHAQRRLADLLAARQVVVEDSRHLMMLDCPQRIADAVRAVEEEA